VPFLLTVALFPPRAIAVTVTLVSPDESTASAC
jgi:hypothetical protein